MNTFVHQELNTDDPAKAKQFYKSLFKWSFQDMPMADGSVYHMAMAADGPIGGIQKKPMPEAPTAWLGYVGVASVKRTMAKAAALGAQIIVPPQTIPGMGSFGIFIDPTGAALAVWEAAAKPKKKVAKKAKKKVAKKKVAKKAKKKVAKRAKKKVAKKRR